MINVLNGFISVNINAKYKKYGMYNRIRPIDKPIIKLLDYWI